MHALHGTLQSPRANFDLSQILAECESQQQSVPRNWSNVQTRKSSLCACRTALHGCNAATNISSSLQLDSARSILRRMQPADNHAQVAPAPNS